MHYHEHLFIPINGCNERTKELVDELVEIESRLSKLKVRDDIKRSDELKKQLREEIKSCDPDHEVTINGNGCSVVFSACPVEKVVTHKDRLKRLVGSAEFTKMAQFPLSVLKQHLGMDDIMSVCEEEYGSRRLRDFGETVTKVH